MPMELERYPDLAVWMQRLACDVQGLSMADWSDFLGAVNGALTTARSEARKAALDEADRRLRGFANEHACNGSIHAAGIYRAAARAIRALADKEPTDAG